MFTRLALASPDPEALTSALSRLEQVPAVMNLDAKVAEVQIAQDAPGQPVVVVNFGYGGDDADSDQHFFEDVAAADLGDDPDVQSVLKTALSGQNLTFIGAHSTPGGALHVRYRTSSPTAASPPAKAPKQAPAPAAPKTAPPSPKAAPPAKGSPPAGGSPGGGKSAPSAPPPAPKPAPPPPAPPPAPPPPAENLPPAVARGIAQLKGLGAGDQQQVLDLIHQLANIKQGSLANRRRADVTEQHTVNRTGPAPSAPKAPKLPAPPKPKPALPVKQPHSPLSNP